MVNSLMLLGHSVAAMQGHDGPVPQRRAGAIRSRSSWSRAPYVTSPAGTGQKHAPGWTNSMNGRGVQHLVFDAEVVDGLVYAYRARKELQLPDSTVDAIRDAISRTARGSFWRYPTIRLNQINWYSLMYAADATVTGDPALLKRDFSAQLTRFVRGAKANFGAGMRFHYLPHEHANHPMNVDSAEYANIVLSFTRFYDQARRAGMPAIPAGHKRVVSEWIERAISGYWTHGGYMNWDSGLGFQRWHQSKKFGLTQQALIGDRVGAVASDAKWQRYAKYLFDRSLEFYVRTADRDGGIADALFFNVHAVPQGVGSARLGAARVLANAARAIDAGLGRARSTRAARAVLLRPGHRPARGDDARVQHGDRRRQPTRVPVRRARPGAVVRRQPGRRREHRRHAARVLRRARPRRQRPPRAGLAGGPRRRSIASVTPLQLIKAPAGVGARAVSTTTSAYAGAFTDLRATGTVRGRRARSG